MRHNIIKLGSSMVQHGLHTRGLLCEANISQENRSWISKKAGPEGLVAM